MGEKYGHDRGKKRKVMFAFEVYVSEYSIIFELIWTTQDSVKSSKNILGKNQFIMLKLWLTCFSFGEKSLNPLLC
jgi:hypothetical protein